MDLSTKLALSAVDSAQGFGGSASLKDLAAGDTPGAIAANPAAKNGLYATTLPIVDLRNANGSGLVVTSPGAHDFVLVVNPGTAIELQGHAANAGTAVDHVVGLVTMPPWYVAGKDVTLTANTKLVVSGATAGACTLTGAAWEVAHDGSMTGTADLIGASDNIVGAGSDLTFTIAGGALSPGDHVLIELTSTVIATGTGTVTGQVGSVRVS